MITLNNRTSAFTSLELNDKNDNTRSADENIFKTRNNSFIPEKVTLSWSSLTIRVSTKSYLSLPQSFLNKRMFRKRTEIILNDCCGLLMPGTLTALIGPRLIILLK